MKINPYNLSRILFVSSLLLTYFGCSKSDPVVEKETPGPVTLENPIHNFVWEGLNEIYLWQQDVSDLANSKRENQDSYYSFLNSYNSPEDLFDGLLYQKDVVDKFSFIVDDYVELENSFQGISLSDGLDYRLVRLSGSDDVFGFVRYVANNSNAASKDIKRGDLFLEVDGNQLTLNNYQDLLFGDNTTYTLGLAKIENNSISLTGKTVELTKSQFTENPILIDKVIETGGAKIGYLMYNSFIADFDDELNNAIGNFKSQGITDLVLDLRYNPGGRVSSAVILSSMITGQFNQDVLIKEIWNDRYQTFLEANAPDRLLNRFTTTLLDDTPIETLNLSKVYILTTENSASASELIINGLDAYIDVVQIGTSTTGKYTASVTLYDSPDFSRDNVNQSHTYALQPLVYKSANANGVTDYFNGLVPDHLITYNTSAGTAEGEDFLNLGTLGDMNEPFLAKAIELITSSTTKNTPNKLDRQLSPAVDVIVNSKDFSPMSNRMYIEGIPRIKQP